MKIEKSFKPACKFGDLDMGDVFAISGNDNVYMKVEQIDGYSATYNTVRLQNGTVCNFAPGITVIPHSDAILKVS